MSHLVTAPDALVAAAGELEGIGAALTAANSGAADTTTGVSAPAADQISSAVAALFAGHAQDYQTLSAQISALHQWFVQALTASAESYAAAEASNSEPL